MKHTRLLFAVTALLGIFTPAFGQPPPLKWGGDKAGGAPFIYEEAGKGEVGFEVDLIRILCNKLGRTPKFVQCDWDNIPEILERGNIDIGLNGLEYREEWEQKTPSTLPYFAYSLRLIVAKNKSRLDGK